MVIRMAQTAVTMLAMVLIEIWSTGYSTMSMASVPGMASNVAPARVIQSYWPVWFNAWASSPVTNVSARRA